MIFITGDTHMNKNISKLNTKNFPKQKQLSKNDYVIITGDAGFIWDNSKTQKWWLNNITNRNFTTLFVDGNHENFDILNKYPVEEWNGGLVHKITPSIIHLMRGQVYTIEGKKFFTFGGASSIDICTRIPGIDWWKEELPNKAEIDLALENLEKHDFKVDYILSHTCSTTTLQYIAAREQFYIEDIDCANQFLEYIKGFVEYKKWFFGHFHLDYEIKDKEIVCFNNIHSI